MPVAEVLRQVSHSMLLKPDLPMLHVPRLVTWVEAVEAASAALQDARPPGDVILAKPRTPAYRARLRELVAEGRRANEEAEAARQSDAPTTLAQVSRPIITDVRTEDLGSPPRASPDVRAALRRIARETEWPENGPFTIFPGESGQQGKSGCDPISTSAPGQQACPFPNHPDSV